MASEDYKEDPNYDAGLRNISYKRNKWGLFTRNETEGVTSALKEPVSLIQPVRAEQTRDMAPDLSPFLRLPTYVR